MAQALAADAASLFHRAERAVVLLHATGLDDARVVASQAAVGGGGAPGVLLPSAAVSLPGSMAVPLRCGAQVSRGEFPAVVGRRDGGRLLLDLRSVSPDDDDRLAAAIIAADPRFPRLMPRASCGERPCR